LGHQRAVASEEEVVVQVALGDLTDGFQIAIRQAASNADIVPPDAME
jgi:hypothetical protein